eukprot:TRINITY_DN5265_c0_g1_i2.p6 TRINITY_DN5265_c0_g1~~TRINITY_DN5265_c0_g1_i2.p6  ORF type:complete len:125 (-),score=36.43 TRINITY_DN5265_c0_g1_i2:133-507(-)
MYSALWYQRRVHGASKKKKIDSEMISEKSILNSLLREEKEIKDSLSKLNNQLQLLQSQLQSQQDIYNKKQGEIYSLQENLELIDSTLVPLYKERDKINIILNTCLLYTSPSPRDLSTSRMPSSA